MEKIERNQNNLNPGIVKLPYDDRLVRINLSLWYYLRTMSDLTKGFTLLMINSHLILPHFFVFQKTKDYEDTNN